jgi:hypothetical protein
MHRVLLTGGPALEEAWPTATASPPTSATAVRPHPWNSRVPKVSDADSDPTSRERDHLSQAADVERVARWKVSPLRAD